MDEQYLKEQIDDETLKNVANSLWMQEFDISALSRDLVAVLHNNLNSNLSFGRRFQKRMQDLISNPESYTPNYKELYTQLSNDSENLSPLQVYARTLFLGLDSARGYQELPKHANFKFPDADAPHFEYQVGWHFFVGSCWDGKGQEYGVEFMIWQHSLLPPDLAKKCGLNNIKNQIIELHLGISRAGDRHYRSKPIVLAGTSGLIEFEGHPFRYKVGKNHIQSLDQYKLFPLNLKAWGIDLGFEESLELELNLNLQKMKDYLLQGDDGCSPCCGGVGTLYYSAPHLELGPLESSIKIGEEQIDLVKGKFWYDHQWGTGFLPGGSPRNPVIRAANNLAPEKENGWDWFMIQFDNNHELTLYGLHNVDNKEFYQQSGPNPPGVMDVEVKGKYVDEKGDVRQVKGNLIVDRWVKSKRSPYPALYPASDTWYPDRWTFHLEDKVPAPIREFVMTPIVDGGQTGFFANGLEYSEGAVYVKSLDGDMIGRGFAESTNYADTKLNVLKLAALPSTSEMLEKLKLPKADGWLKFKSFLYLNLPSNKKKLNKMLESCLKGF